MTSNQPISYWTTNTDLLDPLRLAATPTGLCKLALGRESDADFYAWLARVLRPARLTRQKTPLIDLALDEIAAYLAGELRVFQTPLDLRGTAFQRQVWSEVCKIPYGQTASYGELAARVGRPGAARAVGAANGANPLPLFVPCQRLIGSDGALRGYGGGLEIKAVLLRLEGAVAKPGP
jgi:O-6-methylguanine DNA methyltransferase